MRVGSFVDQLVVRGPLCRAVCTSSVHNPKGRVSPRVSQLLGFPRTTYGVVQILLVKYAPLLLLRNQHAVSSMSYGTIAVTWIRLLRGFVVGCFVVSVKAGF